MHDYNFQKRLMNQEAKEKMKRNIMRFIILLAGCVIGIYLTGGFNSRIYLEGDVFGMLASAIAGVFGSFALLTLTGYDS